MATKNITLKIDQEAYRRARLCAVERDTSISGLVRDFLESLSSGDREALEEQRRRQRELLERLWTISDGKPRSTMSATMGSRDEQYGEVIRERGLR